MLRMLAALIAILLHTMTAHSKCDARNAVWAAERDDMRYLIYGDQGVDYGSSVFIEGWHDSKLAWRGQGDVTCSNGASVCHLIVENGRDDPKIGKSDIVLETIDDDGDGVAEWVTLASFGQTMWSSWGLKVEWMDGIPRAKHDPIYPPNIYKLSNCKGDIGSAGASVSKASQTQPKSIQTPTSVNAQVGSANWCIPGNGCTGPEPITRDGFNTCEEYCALSNPTNVRGLDAILYDVECKADHANTSYRMMLGQYRDFDGANRAYIVRPSGIEELEECR